MAELTRLSSSLACRTGPVEPRRVDDGRTRRGGVLGHDVQGVMPARGMCSSRTDDCGRSRRILRGTREDCSATHVPMSYDSCTAPSRFRVLFTDRQLSPFYTDVFSLHAAHDIHIISTWALFRLDVGRLNDLHSGSAPCTTTLDVVAAPLAADLPSPQRPSSEAPPPRSLSMNTHGPVSHQYLIFGLQRRRGIGAPLDSLERELRSRVHRADLAEANR